MDLARPCDSTDTGVVDAHDDATPDVASTVRHVPPSQAPVRARPLSDAERYAWIRSHRGNFLILEAMSRANFDQEFDALIDEAIRSQRRGQQVPTVPASLPQRRRRSDWE